MSQEEAAIAFVVREQAAAGDSASRVLWRFLRELRPVFRTLPISLALIAIACISPQVFLWYVGEYVTCQKPACAVTAAGMAWPVTLGGLGLIAGVALSFRVFCWMFFELLGMWATSDLHDRMVHAVAHVRTTYFDEHPSARLLNRMIGDYGQIRSMGIFRLSDTLNGSIEVLAICGLVMLMHPWAALAILPVTAMILYTQSAVGHMRAYLQDHLGRARSEKIHRLTDLIEGGAIFRLFGRESSLLTHLARAYTRYAETHMVVGLTQAWGRFWVKMLASLYGFVVMIFLCLGLERGLFDLPLAAVIISSLFALTGVFNYLSTSVMNMTETLGNVRRVFQLLDLPPEESEEKAPALGPPIASPVMPAAEGDIVFRDFHMAYRPGMRESLRGVSLTIPFAWHVGVVGRTGAGKSSLVQALFRMVHVTGGDVLHNGTSIYHYDMDAWRALFGFVPQSPYLFQGDIRLNLDREGRFADADLAHALQQVGLDLPLGQAVVEGGLNLSSGERQLICLARLLLLKRRYVILDEPTSAMDQASDARVHAVLSTHFRHATVLVIAHRLSTLNHCQRIVTIEDGHVVAEVPGPAACLGSLLVPQA